jgi:hypothetical protein
MTSPFFGKDILKHQSSAIPLLLLLQNWPFCITEIKKVSQIEFSLLEFLQRK